MRRIRPVKISVHPALFEKMDAFRKECKDKRGINLSQMQLTNIISKKLRFPDLNKIDLIGGKL